MITLLPTLWWNLLPWFIEWENNGRKLAAGKENMNYWLRVLHFVIVNSLFKWHLYVSCLLADKNIMCREQLETASGQPCCDPADGMQQWEPTDLNCVQFLALTHCVISAPITSFFFSFILQSGTWKHAPTFQEYVEIYRWKTLEIDEALLVKVPTLFEGLYKESCRKIGLWKLNVHCES